MHLTPITPLKNIHRKNIHLNIHRKIYIKKQVDPINIMLSVKNVYFYAKPVDYCFLKNKDKILSTRAVIFIFFFFVLQVIVVDHLQSCADS